MAKHRTDEFLFPFLNIIGVEPDEEVARKARLRVRDVEEYRTRNGIKAPAPPAPAAPKPMNKRVAVTALRTDGGTQQRASMSEEAIADYVDVLGRGALPPVKAMDDGEHLWLYDGFHRLEAHKRAGRTDIEVEVSPGTMRDAILASVGVNANHGLRRTNQDKRNAVFTLLRDPEWSGWTNVKIAEATGTTHPFVGNLRRELAEGTANETVTAEPEVPQIPGQWTWGKAKSIQDRIARIEGIASIEEATKLLMEPGLQKEVINQLEYHRANLEKIQRSSLRGLLRDLVSNLGREWPVKAAPAGRLGAVLARLAREAVEEGPVLTVREIREIVVDLEEVEVQLQRKAITDPQRLAAMEIAHGIERMGLPDHSDKWRINTWLENVGLFGLPQGLEAIARGRLERIKIQEAERAAAPAQKSVRTQAEELLQSPFEAAWQVESLEVVTAAVILRWAQNADDGDRWLMELRLRAAALGGKVVWCPRPLCGKAYYIESDVYSRCPRCYSTAANARRRWDEEVASAPKQMAECRRILELAGRMEEPARPLGRMTVAYVGTLAELRSSINLAADDFIVVLEPSAEDDLLTIKKQVHYEVDLMEPSAEGLGPVEG